MTLDEVKNYLKLDDYTGDDSYLTELIDVSQIYIDSCVSEDYKTDTNLVKLSGLLQKKLISDMYDNRSSYVTNDKRDIMVTTILNKLAMAQVIDDTVV
ncbi:MAG: putative phage protein [Anaerocolumna sp.]|jgi:uncharacterized phage protein (predicted DNA packaging)|nr:putative phage protein [Anaerocolumna sp.]